LLKISTMSTVELKGNFLNFLAEIEDPGLLRRMLSVCLEMANKEAIVEGMPPEILTELQEAVRMSDDEANLVPHETVIKDLKTWLRASAG
jgi:hypothetical protein